VTGTPARPPPITRGAGRRRLGAGDDRPAGRRGVETAGRGAGVVDGSDWCQQFLDLYRSDAIRILDFLHAVQRRRGWQRNDVSSLSTELPTVLAASIERTRAVF
jgi:hypothetical protein